LTQASQDADAARTKVKVLTQRLDAAQAQRVPLDAAIQQASTILSKVTTEVRLEVLEKEMATAKYKIAEFQQGIFEWDKRLRAMKAEHLEITQKVADAEWRANQIRMRAQFAAANPAGPGIERVRH